MYKYKLFVLFLTIQTVIHYRHKVKAFRTIQDNGVETILALEDEKVIMSCRTDMPIRYCGFIHPSGKRYSFTGQTTSDGKCSIEIHPTSNDTGTWRCHIGSPFVGVETMKLIELRVVGQLAAVQSNITAIHGKSCTLHCTTTQGLIPLSYCRFEPPNAVPFNVDSSVTEKKPLLKRYYFPNNKSLDRGDCAVTIRKVKSEDFGIWTCGAGFGDGNEYIDVINFKVEGLHTMSTPPSAIIITYGVIALIVLLSLLGFFSWRYRRVLGSMRRQDETVQSHELEHMPPVATSSQTRIPLAVRNIPTVTIQSPSEASESGTSTPLVSPEE